MLEIVVSAAVGGAVAAVVVQVARDWEHRRRLAAAEARMDSLENARYGLKGREARDDKKEEMVAAMMEAGAVLKDPSVTDKGGALVSIAMKYPSVAQELMKRGFKL